MGAEAVGLAEGTNEGALGERRVGLVGWDGEAGLRVAWELVGMVRAGGVTG